MSGVLTVVGLGPGDPELVTVKAAQALGEARLIAFFASRDGGAGHARRIADRWLRAPCEELRLQYPVTTELAPGSAAYRCLIDDFHDRAAARLGARLERGEHMALLCEGDPFFYGSSMHLHDRLRARFSVRVIPGITAMSGAWSEAALPIAHGDDAVAVVPGTVADARLDALLGGHEAHVVMKLGRQLPRVRAALARAGRLDDAVYVEHATGADALVERLAARDPERAAPYFSLLLVPGRKGAR